jgi:hypothetical protein
MCGIHFNTSDDMNVMQHTFYDKVVNQYKFTSVDIHRYANDWITIGSTAEKRKQRLSHSDKYIIIIVDVVA